MIRAHESKSREEQDDLRVSLEYEIDLSDRTQRVELPFVMGVLADLQGSKPYEPGSLRHREFRTVDRENFDDYMRWLGPRLKIQVTNRVEGMGELSLDLGFECMADFEPERLVKRVPALQRLLERRDEAIELLKQGSGSAAEVEACDDVLSGQLSALLQHPDFQRLEGSWRGLHFLVDRAPISERIKIRVLPISRRELDREARLYAGPLWDHSALFHQLYIEEYGKPGGELLGCFIADFEFDHSPTDMGILRLLSRIGAASDAPFLTGLAPSYFQLERWGELRSPLDVEFKGDDYAEWRELRAHPDSRFIGLTAPRFLARLPYGTGKGRQPCSGFPYEELNAYPSEPSTWSNMAYMVGLNLLRAFGKFSWCAHIRGSDSGGFIDELPGVTAPNTSNSTEANSPLEVAVGERMEVEFHRHGLMVPNWRKEGGQLTFWDARSLHKPAEYEDPDATDAAQRYSWLNYLMAVCRFAHYLKCISRDCHQPKQELETSLNEWLGNYVDEQPGEPGAGQQARYPLRVGNVKLETDGAFHEVTLRCQPDYQLEGLKMPMMHKFRMVNPDYRPSSLH